MSPHLGPEENTDMSRSTSLIVALCVAAAATATPRMVSAQSSGTIECDSPGSRRHCAVAGIDPESVTMNEKLSKTNCIRGQNWDADAQGVWVSGGCRARFDFVRKAGASSSRSSSSAGTNECDSPGGRRHCAVAGIDPESVTMDEKLSKANCIRGESWDADGEGIWVSGGCRARFGFVRKSGGGGYGGGHKSSTSAMKAACIQQASRQWGVTDANLEISMVSPQANGTTELAVQSPRTKGYCLFDAQGSFVRLTPG
jgi:hypothetical protein